MPPTRPRAGLLASTLLFLLTLFTLPAHAANDYYWSAQSPVLQEPYNGNAIWTGRYLIYMSNGKSLFRYDMRDRTITGIPLQGIDSITGLSWDGQRVHVGISSTDYRVAKYYLLDPVTLLVKPFNSSSSMQLNFFRVQNKLLNFDPLHNPYWVDISSTETRFRAGLGCPLVWRGSTRVYQVGTKFVLWGGSRFNGTTPEYFNDGAVYDATTGGWNWIAASPLAARDLFTAVDVGGKLMIHGGGHGINRFYQNGAFYDPYTNQWSAPFSLPSMAPRHHGQAVFDGKNVIFWGGSGGGIFGDGLLLNPVTMSTDTLTTANQPRPRTTHRNIWGGTDYGMMIISGTETLYGAVPSIPQLMEPQDSGEKPVPTFRTDITTQTTPFSVRFYDLSTGRITGREWDFENDGIVDSTESQPVHQYSVPGTYDVRLRVTNDFGTSETIVRNCIYALQSGIAREFVVNSLEDGTDANPGDGLAETWPGNGQVTLRSAIEEANYRGLQPTLITFATTGTIRLQRLLLPRVACNLRIIGPGQEKLTIRGQQGYGGLVADSSATLAISDLAFEGGALSTSIGTCSSGGGAAMGAALFVNTGAQVHLSRIRVSSCQLYSNTPSNQSCNWGAFGGSSAYNITSGITGPGGFGAGGAGNTFWDYGFDGGFGGGAGAGKIPGRAGMFGGAATTQSGGSGAALGAALFIRTGARCAIEQCTFDHNTAGTVYSSSNAQHKGGAIFAMEGTTVSVTNSFF